MSLVILAVTTYLNTRAAKDVLLRAGEKVLVVKRGVEQKNS